MREIRAVIVDDEAAARSRIRKLVRGEPDVAVVAEAANGREAVQAVCRHEPDLLFLDVQMPGMDGFAVLEALLHRSVSLPEIVFVTAYDRYALRAFEARALDYLLKPFDDERFREALGHVRRRLRERASDRLRVRLRSLLEESPAEPARRRPGAERGAAEPGDRPGGRRIPVRRHDRIVLLDVEEVEWIEAAGDYVRLHAGERSHLVRSSMAELEEALGEGFVRVHRSAIVRLDAVRELSPRTHGDYEVVLRDGARLRLSRSYRASLAAALGVEL